MFADVYSMGLCGLDAFTVHVECDISQGMPSFDIVGLPGTAIKESRNRIRAALRNIGMEMPVNTITVNLAPADIKKEGPLYDLPILLSIISATDHLPINVKDCIFAGELSLTGEIAPVKGILPMAIEAANLGFKKIFVPIDNAQEASVAAGIEVYGISCVEQLLDHLLGRKILEPVKMDDVDFSASVAQLDFCDVTGQREAKRAMEVAAAGSHNVLLIGPPGSGKSMLANRLPSILPEMTLEESLETSKIHSVAGCMPANVPLMATRPFRSPHHTISPAALAGGGKTPKPGEISLSHNGVLFLDELPEFARNSLEVLRQPIEDQVVTIARVSGTLSFPCSVMLVCAMNPCSCGYFGHPTKSCICGRKAVEKYLSKVSGPLLDRLDLHVEVPPVDYVDLSKGKAEESSLQIRERVNKARKIQEQRFIDENISANAKMQASMIHKYCKLTEDAERLIHKAYDSLGLSARAYSSLMKVSRTIADLDGEETIASHHIAEAIQYRSLDRKYWGRE